MRATHEVTPDARHIAAALAGLVAENVSLLQSAASAGAALPKLYARAPRYKAERRPHEDWQNVEQLYAAGSGDCEDLASARAAELQVTGADPAARAVAYRSAPDMWHCVVARGDGTIEDPSRRLGMGRPGARTMGTPALGYEVKSERDGLRATVRLRRHDGGVVGISIFRRLARGVSKFAKKVAKSKLLRAAVKLARKALSSPFLQSLLPPQVALALRAASAIAKVAKRGGPMAAIAAKLKEAGLSQLATLATHVEVPR